jgi:hypothetical protein
MCNTDHFWQFCDIYRNVQCWPFLTVVLYVSICAVLTISDSTVIYIDIFVNDHFWQWCDICRYVHCCSFVTVLFYISICSLLTISDSAVKYIDTCTTDHLKPYFNIYRLLHYWPFRTVQCYSENSEYFALKTAVNILLSVDVAWHRQRNSNLHTYCCR